MDILKSVGKRIQTIREKRGFTQEQMENSTGLNSKHISAIERGLKNITIKTLEKIAKGLEIEMYELFLFSEEPESEESIRKATESLLKETDLKTLQLCLQFLKSGQT
jgi:transcriptional regulator with XRE-family HTH domain